jgi:Cu(I)/Ag(I) efflux system membrane protein CusA/SilA
MIPLIIRASITNRLLVIVLAIMLAVAGVWAIRSTPVDAIPDLSDVQVIIKTPYPGQAPQVVEDQVTFPITTAMLAVPGATDVRGFSFFGDSFVYIVFEDGTDLYWARSRVLEYLQQIAADLPEGVSPELGPDATGVGWIYQYALIDRTGGHDLAQLRTLQDWFLKFELQTVPGVSEVATIGGTSCAPMISRCHVSGRRSRPRTGKPGAASSRWAKRNTWCAPPAMWTSWRIWRPRL